MDKHTAVVRYWSCSPVHLAMTSVQYDSQFRSPASGVDASEVDASEVRMGSTRAASHPKTPLQATRAPAIAVTAENHAQRITRSPKSRVPRWSERRADSHAFA